MTWCFGVGLWAGVTVGQAAIQPWATHRRTGFRAPRDFLDLLVVLATIARRRLRRGVPGRGTHGALAARSRSGYISGGMHNDTTNPLASQAMNRWDQRPGLRSLSPSGKPSTKRRKNWDGSAPGPVERVADMRWLRFVLMVVFSALVSIPVACIGTPTHAWPVYMHRLLRSTRFVDLTHSFHPGIPHWEGFPDETRETLFTYAEDGFLAHRYCFVGQWGTHIDAPAHFAPGLRTIDEISANELFLPLVVIDVHESVHRDPDYVVSMKDLFSWENKHGPIPSNAFVALRTDWSRRWANAEAFSNRDEHGISHCPGWSLSVVKYLFTQRKVAAIGHETANTDPGLATSAGDYSIERYVLELSAIPQ